MVLPGGQALVWVLCGLLWLTRGLAGRGRSPGPFSADHHALSMPTGPREAGQRLDGIVPRLRLWFPWEMVANASDCFSDKYTNYFKEGKNGSAKISCTNLKILYHTFHVS